MDGGEWPVVLRGGAMDGVIGLARRERWARQQFGSANLGDVRRTRRLIDLAVRMAGNSSGSIPQQAGGAAAMKAAYRLFASEAVTHAGILQPHIDQTRAQAEALPRVFLVQDTTELNFTGHGHCEGLGAIGHGGMLRGLHQQSVLAVDPIARRPLGLMYQRLPRRTERPAGYKRAQRRRTPLTERASYWWVAAIREIGPPPPSVTWVHVGDRGEDIFGVYDEARTQGSDWLIRAAYNRRVQTPTGLNHLFSYARGLPSMGSRMLTVRSLGKPGTREAVLHVSAGPVALLPAKTEKEYRERAPISCWVVRTWEPAPPEGESLEWILLTSLPCQCADQGLSAVEAYALRWMIEEFHKCEKTGCNVEARRLTHTDRLEPLIGLLSVLAVWLLALKYMARDEPHRPANEFFDDKTVAVMTRYLRHKSASLTIGEFWRGIGRLGGHPGRTRDGPLGWLRAWRGWQSFELILLGASLVHENHD